MNYMEKNQPVKILWVSRHSPLPCQQEYLKQKLGEVAVEMLVGYIPNAEFVVEEAKRRNARYILPVLPLSFIARLVELCRQHDCVVLWSKMRNVATTKDVAEAARIVNERPDCRTAVAYADGIIRVYEFDAIEKIVEVKLITEPL